MPISNLRSLPFKLTALHWATALIALQAIYLILELAFNARLVDSVSIADSQYFEYLGHLGRILSGAGCCLLVFSLLRKWQAGPVAAKMLVHVLVALIAFPTVYYGQEKLIDHLVDSSDAEQRVHAQYIALLKRGLASNALVFKDIEFTAEDTQRPAAKTFINSIGFAVFFAPGYLQSVAENSDTILRHLASRQADQMLPDAYDQYLQARDQVAEVSAQYNQANQEFEQQAEQIAPQAREIWRELFVELQRQWNQLNSNARRHQLNDGFDLLYDKLDLYFTAKNRCGGGFTDRCLQKVNEEYQTAMLQMFNRTVLPEYWCKPIPAKTSQVLRGGQFVEVHHPSQLDCSIRNKDFIRERYLKLHGVSQLSYESFDAFMGSAEVAATVREKLAEQGIHMPANYRLRSHQSFLKGVEHELTKPLAAAFADNAQQQLGLAIAPRLSSQQFLQHDLVQAPLRQALGLSDTAKPMALDLSERAFHEQILMPQLEDQYRKERARLLAQTSSFADGEPYAEDGKMYVRSVLVPPIAMGMSLFFGLLNAGGLIAVLLVKAQLPAKAILASRGVFIVLVLVLPLLLPSQIAQTEPFQKIVDETRDSLGAGRHYVSWLVSLQPIIYPAGAVLADSFSLFGNEQ